MKKTIFIVITALLVFTPTARPDNLPALPQGPLLLTSVQPEQLNPDYWINRLAEPDVPLKTPEELARFNREIHDMISQRVDVFAMQLSEPGSWVRGQLKLEYSTLRGRILFDVGDRQVPKNFFEREIKPLVNWQAVPDQIKLKWGAATTDASVRALPTDVRMFEEVGDIEFDQLQFTLIKLWTPVAVLHRSEDDNWLYVQAPYVRGWVKAKDVAMFESRSELRKFAKPDRFLVVTGNEVPIVLDSALHEVNQFASMGTLLPIAGKIGNAHVIWLPLRRADGSILVRQAHVDLMSDVSEGFLAFTQRNIIHQAFKLLGARYGWGGTYKGRDCSGFTHDVFLSMGVDMPRDSKQQGFVGTQLGHFKPFENRDGKISALRASTPAITLLRMSMHLMLYLGEVDGKFYIIHSTWAERISRDSDEKVRINQVVVSDLSLNGNSYLGSLFDRTISINEVH